MTVNEINQIPNFFSLERAFFDVEINALNRTHVYFYDGLNWQISIPKLSKDDPIISSLLSIRPFIIFESEFCSRKARRLNSCLPLGSC